MGLFFKNQNRIKANATRLNQKTLFDLFSLYINDLFYKTNRIQSGPGNPDKAGKEG